MAAAVVVALVVVILVVAIRWCKCRRWCLSPPVSVSQSIDGGDAAGGSRLPFFPLMCDLQPLPILEWIGPSKVPVPALTDN